MVSTQEWSSVLDREAGTFELSPGVEVARAWTVSGVVAADDGKFGTLTARVELGPSGRYEIRWLKTEVPAGTSVSGELLRSIRVAELLKNVVRPHHKPSKPKRAGAEAAQFDSLTPEIRERMREAGPVTETLKMVAIIYQTAYAIGAPPTREVAEAFGIPRPTADRWVRRARDRKFLGAAESGRAAI